MDRRHTPRVCVQLPVEVWGMDAFGRPFTDSAIVTNLSAGGLVLNGLRRKMKPGEMVDVRMGANRAQYKVIWIAAAGELGMQNVTAQNFLPQSVLIHCAQAAAAC